MSIQRQHYHHTSAWKPEELGDKSAICESLGARYIESFDRALRAVQLRDINVEDIRREDFPLDDIAEDIARWEHVIQEGRGIFMLTGFPVDKYSKEECGIIYYGLGAHFGEAQSQSLMGDRLGHVIGVGGKDTRERAYRNSAELAFAYRCQRYCRHDVPGESQTRWCEWLL